MAAFFVKDDTGHREEKILHIHALLYEETVERVAELEHLDFLVSGFLLGLRVKETDSLPVAGEDIEKFVLAHHHVLAHLVNNLVWQLVIRAKGNVHVFLALNHQRFVVRDTVIVKNGAAVLAILRIGGSMIRETARREANTTNGIDLFIAICAYSF